ncbi:UDP-glycosyltransferase 76E1-like [Rhodamnia argentea]|uniref:UDP-glycosyltransferase 76E1-like n=1 Tax=Rhodamnia argentea TaxID=178133 RepID=A0A8B8PSZ7_9MYRT|nr:UDP-glycosyltransferase 76E1-like [Rhodamnia argentea]
MAKAGDPRRRLLVLVPCPYQGHLNPMLQLGAALQSTGSFSITVAHTEFNFPNQSNHPQFHFLPIADGLSDADTSLRGFVSLVLKLNVNCKTSFQESLTRLRERTDWQEDIACIIYDGLMYFAEEVARELKIPCIIFRTCSAATSSLYNEYPQLQEEGFIPLQDSKALEFVPRLHPLRFKDLSIYKFEGFENLLPLLERSSQVGSSVAFLLNTIECLEQSSLMKLRQAYPVPFFTVGPVHKIAPPLSSSLIEEDESCIAWLNKQAKNSTLYVSLGSVASIDEKELVEMAWGLANCQQPFLWVVRPGLVHGSEGINLLPDGFAEIVGERGRVIKWAPQQKVLAHESVGAFWSHCGWNSTLESISEGVPMICTPCFGDQRGNARYLSHVWRVGLLLEDMERGEIERAIKKLMASEEGETVRQRMTDLKREVIHAIKEGGSTYDFLDELVKYINAL